MTRFLEVFMAVMGWLGISTLAAATWFLFRQQEHDEYDPDQCEKPDTDKAGRKATPPEDPEV